MLKTSPERTVVQVGCAYGFIKNRIQKPAVRKRDFMKVCKFACKYNAHEKQFEANNYDKNWVKKLFTKSKKNLWYIQRKI